MAPLRDKALARNHKALIIADSGAGKTGALASLAVAGYNLRIMDFDNGTEILQNLLAPNERPYMLSPEASDAAISRVDVEVLTDKFKAGGSQPIPATATAYQRGVGLISKWGSLGPIHTWGPKDVLVIDSLNFMGRAAVRLVCNMNGRLGVPPQIQDYFTAQRMVEAFLATLYDEQIGCNVVVLSHIREVGKTQRVEKDDKIVTVEEEGSRRGYAETGTGNALSPMTGRYFNSLLMVDIMGTGTGARRVLRTVPHENIMLKNPAPGRVKAEYKLEHGLAEYFEAVTGSKPL